MWPPLKTFVSCVHHEYERCGTNLYPCTSRKSASFCSFQSQNFHNKEDWPKNQMNLRTRKARELLISFLCCLVSILTTKEESTHSTAVTQRLTLHIIPQKPSRPARVVHGLCHGAATDGKNTNCVTFERHHSSRKLANGQSTHDVTSPETPMQQVRQDENSREAYHF